MGLGSILGEFGSTPAGFGSTLGASGLKLVRFDSKLAPFGSILVALGSTPGEFGYFLAGFGSKPEKIFCSCGRNFIKKLPVRFDWTPAPVGSRLEETDLTLVGFGSIPAELALPGHFHLLGIHRLALVAGHC